MGSGRAQADESRASLGRQMLEKLESLAREARKAGLID
jgi:hypothetical protein